jgi:RimJ/RimL family protein N-acetyltransferase
MFEVDGVIVGTKVVLRPKQVEDAPDDHRWRQDPELAELDAASMLRQGLADFTHDLETELKYPTPWVKRFAIDNLEGQHVGNCMAYDIDTISGQAEIGILVGERDHWDGGYAREAFKLLIDELFKTESMNRLYLHTLRWNARARRAFAGSGMREVGPDPRGGHDFILMEITRAEWGAHRQQEFQRTQDASSAE